MPARSSSFDPQPCRQTNSGRFGCALPPPREANASVTVSRSPKCPGTTEATRPTGGSMRLRSPALCPAYGPDGVVFAASVISRSRLAKSTRSSSSRDRSSRCSGSSEGSNGSSGFGVSSAVLMRLNIRDSRAYVHGVHCAPFAGVPPLPVVSPSVPVAPAPVVPSPAVPASEVSGVVVCAFCCCACAAFCWACWAAWAWASA